MNKKILSKLKMERPEYYDSTDNKVAVIPKMEIEKVVKKSYWHGFQLGSLFGTLGIVISSLLALVTAKDFNSFLGIDSPTWKAIFILLLFGSTVVFIMLLIITIRNFWKGNFKDSKIIEEFFKDDKKI